MKSLAIEREFGSGGREIGMRVAELAGIPYYDGELLIKAAEAQGVSIRRPDRSGYCYLQLCDQ